MIWIREKKLSKKELENALSISQVEVSDIVMKTYSVEEFAEKSSTVLLYSRSSTVDVSSIVPIESNDNGDKK
jgi:predicted XRE-type DNA-binding protein